MKINTALINNVKTFAFHSKQALLEYVVDKKKILIALNAEKVLKKDKKLITLINNNIGYSDGISIVWALKKKGIEATKIPGVEIWFDIIKKYPTKSFYLMGSTQEVIEKTTQKLRAEFPAINIVAYRNGFIKNQVEKDKIKAQLTELKPDVVFVAQGSPRQEYLMEELLKIHPALYVGLGGSFDVYCGFKSRAPTFFINNGLEWFYRLLKEPTRISRQMVLIKFWWLYIFNKL